MLTIERASSKDAKELLAIQTKAFDYYTKKYGDFERNPAKMSLARIKFNINYPFGQYYTFKLDGKIIGGLFAFLLDDENVMKIAQFYLMDEYVNQGYGSIALQYLFNQNPQIKKWIVDTIYEEKKNVAFYQKHGFEIIDEEGYDAFEPEHEGLTFVTLKKTVD